MERRGFYGWVVKIKRRKREHVKYFRDENAGPPESLERAIAHRDRLFRELAPPTKIMVTHRRNTTGIIGVSREVSRTSSGGLAENWVGKWVELDGKSRRRAFSVNKYGEEEAKAPGSSRRVGRRSSGLSASAGNT
jgi:hypothetical protein